MDRGFGSFRGNTGFSNDRDRYSRDERRYDDFYDNRRSGGNNRNMNKSGARGNQGGWSGSGRDRGFGQGNTRGGNVGVQMLASLQQQQHLLNAFMNQQNRRGGILDTPNQRFQGNRGGRGPNRPGDKRRMDQNQSGAKRSRPSNQGRKTAPAKPEKKEEVREPSPDIPDDEVVIPDSLMDAVEKLRQRTDIERNVADEDVQKLLTFSYNGKGYSCNTCGLFLSKEAGFHHHLMGKSHVMNVIDLRTAKKYQPIRDILDIDLAIDDWYEKSEKAREILHKQAKSVMKSQRENERRERENYEKNPGNFFTVKMETKKCATKVGETVTITSLVESTIEVKDFAKDRFFGCEFVKAVTGFQCRLCNIHIKDASGVIPHVDGRVHRNNYQVHLNKNRDYEQIQKEQNKELIEVLTEHEGKDVLLYETKTANELKFLAKVDEDLIREERLLNPPEKKEKEPAESEKEENTEESEDATEESEEKKEEEGEEADTKEEDAERETEEAEDDKVDGDEPTEEEEGEETQENGSVEEDEEPAVEEDNPEAEAEENSQTEDAEVNENAEEEAEGEKKEEEEEKKPKAAAKKTAAAKTKTPTTARRGRGRGGKAASNTRSRRSKGKEETAEEKDESGENSFMDAFHVVDEVIEDY